jgi:2-succinyl-5-enolpyruvyl-6-hydroxy-3-cyclohexene-1-carboxylate synthase
VVVDNGGGAIFEFLPQAAALPESTFERLFGTPQRTDVAAVARGFGLVVREAHNAEELLAGLHELVGSKGLSVLRVVARPRPSNVATHDRIHARVAERVGALFGHPDPESN